MGFLAWCLLRGPEDREGRAWAEIEQGFNPPHVCSCVFLASFIFLSLEPLYQNRGLTVRLLLVVGTNPVAGGQERSLHVIGVFQKRCSTQRRLGRGKFQVLRIWSCQEQPSGARTMVGGAETVG